MPKKIPISIRIDPQLKAAAEKVAQREHRSFTNLIETMILERCQQHGIEVDDQKRRSPRD
jgi:hypothetical protein